MRRLAEGTRPEVNVVIFTDFEEGVVPGIEHLARLPFHRSPFRFGVVGFVSKQVEMSTYMIVGKLSPSSPLAGRGLRTKDTESPIVDLLNSLQFDGVLVRKCEMEMDHNPVSPRVCIGKHPKNFAIIKHNQPSLTIVIIINHRL